MESPQLALTARFRRYLGVCLCGPGGFVWLFRGMALNQTEILPNRADSYLSVGEKDTDRA
jgi:hypothetical protein